MVVAMMFYLLFGLALYLLILGFIWTLLAAAKRGDRQ
jgi:hypothetical protein